MKKVVAIGFVGMVLVLLAASWAAAAEAAAAAAGTVDYTKAIVIGLSVLAAGIAMGVGAVGAGLGLGQATSGGANATGRNPEAQGKIMVTMMVGMAMTESVAIYALVVSLLILYANPLLKYIGIA